MKIEFDATGSDYLEIVHGNPGKILVTLSAKDPKNSLSTIINSVEITVDQFVELTKSLKLPLFVVES